MAGGILGIQGDTLFNLINYVVGGLGLYDQNQAEESYDEATAAREAEVRKIFEDLIQDAGVEQAEATGREQISFNDTRAVVRRLSDKLGAGYDEFVRGQGSRGDALIADQAQFGQGVYDQATSDLSGLEAGYRGRTADVLGDVGAAETDALATLRDRYAKAVEGLVGSGEQETKDIDRRWEERSGANRAELTARGLGIGSLLTASDNASERERGDELGTLRERIRREKLGVDIDLLGDLASAQERFGINKAQFRSGLTGDALAATERGTSSRLGYRAGLGQAGFDLRERSQREGERLGLGRFALDAERLGAEERFGGNELAMLMNQANRKLGIKTGIPQNYANWITNIVDVPPESPWAAYFQNLAQARAIENQPQPSSSSAWGSSLIGAGGSVASAATLGTILAAGICIDAEASLQTPTGRVSLRDVAVGDLVLNSEGEFKPVKAKHLGVPPEARRSDFRRLRVTVSGASLSIVASFDHVIGGKRVEDWENDPLVRVEPCECVEAGDILLEDGSDYMANGLPVSSMIREKDIPDLRRLEPHNQVGSVELIGAA